MPQARTATYIMPAGRSPAALQRLPPDSFCHARSLAAQRCKIPRLIAKKLSSMDSEKGDKGKSFCTCNVVNSVEPQTPRRSASRPLPVTLLFSPVGDYGGIDAAFHDHVVTSPGVKSLSVYPRDRRPRLP